MLKRLGPCDLLRFDEAVVLLLLSFGLASASSSASTPGGAVASSRSLRGIVSIKGSSSRSLLPFFVLTSLTIKLYIMHTSCRLTGNTGKEVVACSKSFL